jgi:hypothetical protein
LSKYTLNLNREKSSHKWGLLQPFSKKPAQSKQSSIGRKFAQSGHPGLVLKRFWSENVEQKYLAEKIITNVIK